MDKSILEIKRTGYVLGVRGMLMCKLCGGVFVSVRFIIKHFVLCVRTRTDNVLLLWRKVLCHVGSQFTLKKGSRANNIVCIKCIHKCKST